MLDFGFFFTTKVPKDITKGPKDALQDSSYFIGICILEFGISEYIEALKPFTWLFLNS